MSVNGALLKCRGKPKSQMIMRKVHGGLYDSQIVGLMMKWILYCHGCFWPTADCFMYDKEFDACYTKGTNLHLVIKPFSFRGWALNLIKKNRFKYVFGTFNYFFLILIFVSFFVWFIFVKTFQKSHSI